MAQFTPFKSFVEASFFTELGKYKLETARLSEDSIPLHGLLSMPATTGRPPALRVSGGSLEAVPAVASDGPLDFYVNGCITNVNTLEAFKELDKSALLQAQARELLASINDLSIVENLQALLGFQIISFSDIKKYKFYYWFVFPALAWKSSAVRGAEGDPALNEAIDKFLSPGAGTQQIVFFIDTDANQIFPFSQYNTLPTSNVAVGVLDFSTEP